MCPVTLAFIFIIFNYVYADMSGREYGHMSGSRCLRRSEKSESLELELQAVCASHCGCWELNGSSGKSTHALNPYSTSASPGYLFLAESLRNWFFVALFLSVLEDKDYSPFSIPAPALRSPQFLLSTFSPSTHYGEIFSREFWCLLSQKWLG